MERGVRSSIPCHQFLRRQRLQFLNVHVRRLSTEDCSKSIIAENQRKSRHASYNPYHHSTECALPSRNPQRRYPRRRSKMFAVVASSAQHPTRKSDSSTPCCCLVGVSRLSTLIHLLYEERRRHESILFTSGY
jgi:hypothetical protein